MAAWFLIDNERGVCYNYTYDSKGNVVKIVETNASGGATLATNTFVYDADERLTSKTYSAVGQTYRPVYEKNASGYVYTDNEVMGITLDGKFTDKVTKDGLRRTKETPMGRFRRLWAETFAKQNFRHLWCLATQRPTALDLWELFAKQKFIQPRQRLFVAFAACRYFEKRKCALRIGENFS